MFDALQWLAEYPRKTMFFTLLFAASILSMTVLGMIPVGHWRLVRLQQELDDVRKASHNRADNNKELADLGQLQKELDEVRNAIKEKANSSKNLADFKNDFDMGLVEMRKLEDRCRQLEARRFASALVNIGPTVHNNKDKYGRSWHHFVVENTMGEWNQFVLSPNEHFKIKGKILEGWLTARDDGFMDLRVLRDVIVQVENNNVLIKARVHKYGEVPNIDQNYTFRIVVSVIYEPE
jgi:hypothetical protein